MTGQNSMTVHKARAYTSSIVNTSTYNRTNRYRYDLSMNSPITWQLRLIDRH